MGNIDEAKHGLEDPEAYLENESAEEGDQASLSMKAARRESLKAHIQYLRVKRVRQGLRDRETELKSNEVKVSTSLSLSDLSDSEKTELMARRIRYGAALTRLQERLLRFDALESELFARWRNAEEHLERLGEFDTFSEDQTRISDALERQSSGSDHES